MHLTQLLVQIGAILVLGRLLARLLQRVGQPSVIAEILAGIALGPSVLGVVWPRGLELLFPESSLNVLGMVAQLGLVFFMFLVGLEFDPKLLQGQMRTSFALANAGIVVPFALGLLLALGVHADLAPEGVGVLPFALFLGTAMSVTAFPVLARILTETRLIRTRVGAIALASAALGDVSAWCLLALVVGVIGAGGLLAAAQTTALTVGYGAFMWGVARPTLARIGPREGGVVSAEVVTVVMMSVIVSAAITEWIGVHALFGAFLVGAAMPRDGGVAAVINEKIEDFVSIVLLPLFFAYSGLRTSIGLLETPQDWLVCATITGVACLGKFGGTAAVARWTGLSARESVALGVLMNTRGLMELVVLNVGLDLGVISPRLFAMMVVMALATTCLTSPLVRMLYPSRRTLVSVGAPSTLTPLPAVRGGLLICVSDPAVAPSLVRVARACAEPGKPVYALHLRPTERPSDYLRDAPVEAVEPLHALIRAAEEVGLPHQALAFPSANPGEDIVRIAALKGGPMVLIGVHRSTLGRDNLGGVAGRVLRECAGDVAVLVDHGVTAVRRVALRVEPDLAEGAAGAERVMDRLVRGGAIRVERTEDADLVVGVCEPGGRLPSGEGPSWLLVRAGANPGVTGVPVSALALGGAPA